MTMNGRFRYRSNSAALGVVVGLVLAGGAVWATFFVSLMALLR